MPCYLTNIAVHIGSHMELNHNALQVDMVFSGNFNVSDFQNSLQTFLDREYNQTNGTNQTNQTNETNEIKKTKNTKQILNKNTQAKEKLNSKEKIIISTAFDGMEVI